MNCENTALVKVHPSNLTQIVAQASSLSERLNSGLFEIGTSQVNELQVSSRLERWCQVVAQGNWEKFQRRFQWDDLDFDTVRPVLGAVRFVDSQVLPSWAETLKEIIQTASEISRQDELINCCQEPKNYKYKIPLDPKAPLPFEGVLLPAVFVARQKLPADLPLELLSETAYLSLERSLLSSLLRLSLKTLELEFSRFRPFGQNLTSFLIRETQGTPSKTQYNAFVQKLLQDGLLTFFQNYPVLARLIGTTLDFWVESTTEFLQRLEADLSEIQQVFSHQGTPTPKEGVSTIELGKITEIDPTLSDPHNQGRTVISLTFDSGLKLVYKPKSLGLEVAYNQFLYWCNQEGEKSSHLEFKVLKIIDRNTYGWVEYVEQLPCKDQAAVQRFYQRAGMLLCLLYALGATDCHHDNLIASGEHLVLIDLETIMYHEPNPITDSLEIREAETPMNQEFYDSVLRTGLLPSWELSKDNRVAYDVSGLGSVYPQPTPDRARRWTFINTDNMHQVYETGVIQVRANVPTLNGVTLSPNDYLEELVLGFEKMYRFLMKHREALLGDDGFLTKLKNQRVRLIFRNTRVYGVILDNTLAPKFLKNGVDRSIELDILARSFLSIQNKPDAWLIYRAELIALEQLDIPYFGASSSSDALTVGLEQPIWHYFKEPSYDQVITRLQKFNEIHLAHQIAMIRGAFYTRVARTHGTEQASEQKTPTFKAVNLSQIPLLTREQLVLEAEAIATEIHSHAIRQDDGSIAWIGLSYILNADRLQMQPLGECLYDGNCGIALFLAALTYITGSTQFSNLALGAIHSLSRIVQTSDADAKRRLAQHLGIGGASGLGSITYSLVKISQFLSCAAVLENAQQIAHLITPELIAADQQLDIIQGAAGTILGLLALYNETGDRAVLDKASLCGQHLLAHRVSVDNAPRAWKTLGERPLTGFSHGAAGIAYALLRLYDVTLDSVYLEAAREGIAYEGCVFNQAVGNWPDYRFACEPNSNVQFMVTWCHGAPGIGLARLGGLSILETEEIHQDVEVALQTTQKYLQQDRDHLCCGQMGQSEVLLVAAQKLSRSSLRQTAHQIAAWVVARAQQTEGYQLFPNLPPQVFNPGLFQGTAGIGYQLLRLAYPEVLPSVLLWE